jgi:hypothetical protein
VTSEVAPRSPASRALAAPVHSVALGPGNIYSASGTVLALYGSYAPLAYNLPWEVLDYVEVLSTYNADYSQAVDNICTLANSGHELIVDAAGKREAKATRDYLQQVARSVQPSSGGIDGVIDKLLHQAAVYGAMAGEWLIDAETDEVIDFADVNPKSIRFFWEEDTQRYEAYQKVTGVAAQAAADRGQKVIAGCIKLNPVTFHYFSFNNAPSSPYGVPPFIAALEPIGIQRDMVANMSQIVKKIGLLGLIDIIVEQLPPKPGETDDQFAARASAYLEEYVKAGEDMVRDGGLVHYDDVTVESKTIAGNASGATNIFKQNEELVFSGLKSMPSVQGRSYSTTETYAGVAYDIIIRNTKKYQRACKRMIESGYWLAATLGGFTPTSLTLDFHPNKTLNRLHDAQSEQLEIKNAAWKWVAGVIDQRGFAQELGYDDVKKEMEEPPEAIIGSLRETVNSNSADSGQTGGTGGGKPDNQNTSGS